jgi:hypothetical protein
MSSSNDMKKLIPQNTIPTPKLTVILNNFMVNTVNHLNKLSYNVDERLSEFDKKMNDIEIMTTLFEAKLESLPEEIKSTFPPLQPCSLDDVNPNFSVNNENNNFVQEKNEEINKVENKEENKEIQEEEKKEENNNIIEEEKKEEIIQENVDENKELSPQEELDQFLSEHTEIQNLYKMLKLGVPSVGVIQKAQLNQLNMDLVNELIDKAKKANPSIH